MKLDEYNMYWAGYMSACSEDYSIDKCIKHADECLTYYKDLQANIGEKQ